MTEIYEADIETATKNRYQQIAQLPFDTLEPDKQQSLINDMTSHVEAFLSEVDAYTKERSNATDLDHACGKTECYRLVSLRLKKEFVIYPDGDETTTLPVAEPRREH